MSPVATYERFEMVHFMNEIVNQCLNEYGFECISQRKLKYCIPSEAIHVLLKARINNMSYYREVVANHEDMVLGNGETLRYFIYLFAKGYLQHKNFAKEFAGFVGMLTHLAIYLHEQGRGEYTNVIIRSSGIFHRIYSSYFFEGASTEYLVRCLFETVEFHNAFKESAKMRS